LPANAARCFTLLQKTCFIDHQHGVVVSERLDHVIVLTAVRIRAQMATAALG
jgi:hypothetical protein